jgi:two-component system, response regulator
MSVRPVLLYVHDNPDDGRALEAATVRAGARFKLQLVKGYYEAIDYLSAQGKFIALTRRPNAALVLVDYFLGSYKGTDLLRWIRERPPLAGTTAVVFSRSSELGHIAECYVAAADYYLVNPATSSGLLTIVQRLDECLKEQPPRVAALRELSVHPELARQALQTELREGLAQHRDLLAEHRERVAQLDASMAQQKERKKQVPFVPKTPPKPDGS